MKKRLIFLQVLQEWVVFVSLLVATAWLLFTCVVRRRRGEEEPLTDKSGDEEKKDTKSSDPKFVVLTYENNQTNENANFFLDQLITHGYSYENVGIDESWTGWHARLQKYTEYLESLGDENTFVVISDARDVLINNASADTFFEKAMSIYTDKKIVVSTEQHCCDTGAVHDDFYVSSAISQKDKSVKHTEVYKKFMREQAYKLDKDYKSDLYYLNFGLLFGKARDLIQVFRLMKMKPGLDDQLLLHKVFYEHPDLIQPDIKHVLLSTAGSGGRECYYQWDHDKLCFQNTATEQYPCFLHTAGNFWSCYHTLKKKLT